MKSILEFANEGFVFFDGGMGSILQEKGLVAGELPETWNIKKPEIIQGIHKAYLDGGADIIKSNTFGANSLKFSDESGDYTLDNIVKCAINNVKNAISEGAYDRPKYVALDVGPLGKLLKPLGDMEFERAVELFAEVVRLGVKHGADLILIETMNDLYEAKAALLAAKENSNLPVFLTTAYDENGKLLTGADAKTVVAMAEGLRADAIGINCSLGPEQMIPVVEELTKYASIPVICNPNAGLPRSENGKTVYDVGPEEFKVSMRKIVEAGARILGGCCGTTPDHIKAVADDMAGKQPKPLTEKDFTIITSYTHSVVFEEKAVLIGERINPTGKKKLKEALRNSDMDYILGEGLTQQDNGADVLDVNAGLPEIDEPAMIEKIIKELQAVCDLPLQIDTTNPEAMERALRIYNGKAMINSVNGKQEVMDEIFPLAKKYGGLIVALTIDEDGIPETAEGRIKIAEKIYAEALKYGIKKKDIIVDPLCMSVSTDKNAAVTTLECVKRIKEELHGHSSLGVSNISFGLPSREYINSTFFSMALDAGLSAAIMNPNSDDMMKAYRTFNALHGLDENCTEYIDFASVLAAKAPVVVAAAATGAPVNKSSDGEHDPLITAIMKGLKDRAASITAEYLKTMDSITIIDDFLVKALDIVGKGFENKTVFLPQLLMSADAAAGAFDVIKEEILKKGGESEKKGKVILATVKGDIHDIGKNIVKVLLENYGFEVYDLGKDVDPELILETAKKENIKLVGLSALMTTTVPSMEATIKLLKEYDPSINTVVGGAVLTQEYADMIGADKYAKDAMETVRFAEEFFK